MRIEQPAQVVLGGSVSLPLIVVTIVILKWLTIGLKQRAPPSLFLKKLKKLFAVLAVFRFFTSVNPTSTCTHRESVPRELMLALLLTRNSDLELFTQ